jgi:hypothetical protein
MRGTFAGLKPRRTVGQGLKSLRVRGRRNRLPAYRYEDFSPSRVLRQFTAGASHHHHTYSGSLEPRAFTIGIDHAPAESNSRTHAATRSICSPVSSAYIGSESTVALRRSAMGNAPGSWPRSA